jgi:DNA sulfur modification protein DndB
MLTNVAQADSLGSLFRSRRTATHSRTVGRRELAGFLGAGWTVARENKGSVRVSMPKEGDELLRDRVWSLFFRLGLRQLSTELEPQINISTGVFQYTVVAIDDEVALAVVVKAAPEPARWRNLETDVTTFAETREDFEKAVRAQYPQLHDRQVVLALFTANLHITPNQRGKLRDLGVVHIEEKDLDYYEKLTSHLGAASKYQLFADMLPGKKIPGLTLRIPAIRSRIGDYYCYTFSISPAYLLKISYVSHRSKGGSDVGTYQRMLTKPRLNKIREYITDDGIFPTNIVLNLDSSHLEFSPVAQHHSGDPDGGVLGLLEIWPAYKSAWIIDGQHRLFAYSGHSKASTGRLSVLAFEGLPSSTQAKLFIDINAKQKSVKQSLLQELYADLKWNAEDPASRVAAVISRAIQELGADPESPFFGRIQTTDGEKNEIRCISLPSMFNALEKGGFYISKERNGAVVEYGPFGSADNETALLRTVHNLKEWFENIRIHVPDWWQLGAGGGGGLAMNDGITALLNVLRSVYQHLESDGRLLSRVVDEQLADLVLPYSDATGEYLASFSESERKAFRDWRGNSGLARRTRRIQEAIRNAIPAFDPPGLQDFLDEELQQTNTRAKAIIDRLELALQSVVVGELRKQFGEGDSGWWTQGVKKEIRLKVTRAFEDDDQQRGAKEKYFDLIDYRTIAMSHWPIFSRLLGYGRGSKDAQTKWLVFLNDKRRIVAHASSGKMVSVEDLAQLEEYERWFSERQSASGITAAPDSDDVEESEQE